MEEIYMDVVISILISFIMGNKILPQGILIFLDIVIMIEYIDSIGVFQYSNTYPLLLIASAIMYSGLQAASQKRDIE